MKIPLHCVYCRRNETINLLALDRMWELSEFQMEVFRHVLTLVSVRLVCIVLEVQTDIRETRDKMSTHCISRDIG